MEVLKAKKSWLTCKVWGAMQKAWLIYKGKILNP